MASTSIYRYTTYKFYGIEKVNSLFFFRTETPEIFNKVEHPPGKSLAKPYKKCMGSLRVVLMVSSVVVLYNPTNKNK